MKDFEKWQVVSFISRFGAQIVGIFQIYIVALILSPFEYGLYQITNGLAKTFGSYQNLGLQSSSTREIAAAKDLKGAFKVFIVSASFRYMVSIPLAVILFLFADYFANTQYLEPRIKLGLQVYAGVILLQAIQGIFNTVLAGLKKFRIIFIYQVVIAVVSFVVTVPLVFYYKFEGTFIAFFILTFISVLILGFYSIRSFKGNFVSIKKREYFTILKDIFSLSLAVYVVKVIVSNWENFGKIILSASITLVLLGSRGTTELVGIFGIAMAYATKIMMISDSVTDVNMTIFTEKFTTNKLDFVNDFVKNYSKVFIATTFVSVSAVFWGAELFQVFFNNKYAGVEFFIPWLVLAFWAYSFINVIKSSIYVPSKRLLVLVINFLALLFLSVLAFFIFTLHLNINVSLAVSMAMATGALLTLGVFYFDVFMKYKVLLLNEKIIYFIVISAPVIFIYALFNLGFSQKFLVYFMYLLASLFLMYKWGVLKRVKA